MSQSGPWSVRESFLGIVVTNAPVVIPMLKRSIDRIAGAASTHVKSSKGDSYQLSSQASKGKPIDSQKEKKKKRFHHPLSLPTKWGSDELITMDQQMMGEGGRAVDDHNKDTKSELSVENRNIEPELEMGNPGRHSAKIRGHCPGDTGRQGDLSPRDIVVTQEWAVHSKC